MERLKHAVQAYGQSRPIDRDSMAIPRVLGILIESRMLMGWFMGRLAVAVQQVEVRRKKQAT